MKIDPSKINGINKSEKKDNVKLSNATNFKNHLHATTSSKKSENNEKALKLLEMSGTNPLLMSDSVAIKQRTVKIMEKVLSGLDLYKNALDNPNINYQQMEGLVTNINLEKDKLLGQVSDLSTNDPLRVIANETAVLVLSESNKYFSSLI